MKWRVRHRGSCNCCRYSPIRVRYMLFVGNVILGAIEDFAPQPKKRGRRG